jgi:leucine dehydrogenase
VTGPGFRIEAAPGRVPVLAPLTPVAGGAGADIDRRAAAVGADLAGGEIVLEQTDDPTLAALAAELDRHGGRIRAMPGPDVPFAVFRRLAAVTRFAVGLAGGDPSPMTALGALAAIRGAAGGLAGLRVAVLGAGRVGGRLADLLAAAGACPIVADLDPARARSVADRTGGTVVAPSRLAALRCDVFSPNARGVAVTAEGAARLGARIVAGAANGPLGPGAAAALAARGIRVVPEEIAGSGWLLALAEELSPAGYDPDRARRRVQTIEEYARRAVGAPPAKPGPIS